MSTTPTADIDELRFRLAGGVHTPGEAGYDDARTLFNSMIDRRPALVARCASPEDVAAAVGHARRHGLELSVRGGGHSVTGLSLNDGGVVLDMRGIDQVEVDPTRRIARVGGGATWAQVDRATQAHGLATTGGRVSTTGVAGLALGGGSGWLERKHGFACDNLVAAELVAADGRLVRASADENPELLWALRGGGGNFGVVTALELRLHEVGPEVFGGLALYRFEHGRELFVLWRDTMRDAPEELSLAFAYSVLPEDDPEAPAELRGQAVAMVVGMHAGPLDEGERALQAIRDFGEPALDAFGPLPYADMQCSIDDPPGYRNYWNAEQLAELPDAAIELIHGCFERRPPGLPQVFVPAWGGALARVSQDDSPLAGRDAAFVVHPLLLWDDPVDDAEVVAWGRGLRDELRSYASGGVYLNFESDTTAARAQDQYGVASYDRLARVKAAWDPDDVFRGSGHVPPAG
jgi:FAD/FMN-containing dehydrogenase